MHIERRYRKWYAIQSIPPSLRATMGRVRFVASLKTEDYAVAERRAAGLLIKWLGLIAKAKRIGGTATSNTSDADFWRTLLADAPEDQRGYFGTSW